MSSTPLTLLTAGLQAVVREHGLERARSDERWLQNVLADYSPQTPALNRVAALAAREGVPGWLQGAVPGMVDAVVAQAVRRLATVYAIEPGAAHDAISAWAQALGVGYSGATPSSVPTTSVGGDRLGQKIQKFLELAEVAEDAGRWQEALEAYNDILALDPAHGEALRFRGVAQRRLGILVSTTPAASASASKASALPSPPKPSQSYLPSPPPAPPRLVDLLSLPPVPRQNGSWARSITLWLFLIFAFGLGWYFIIPEFAKFGSRASQPEATPLAQTISSTLVTTSGYPVPVGQSFRDCSGCPEMVVIPGGSFIMGSPSSEEGRSSDEGPQRTVQVTGPLALGKFEVTSAEWDACVGGGGCSHRPADEGWGRGSRPVMNVSWEDAQQYVRWLSGRSGKRYRLLTEAEWEYAARAGTVTAYSFGSSIGPSQANFGFNVGRTQAVGSYPPNDFGLHDMHGNVREWVEDCYVHRYAGARSDASVAVTSGGCSAPVLRGGSWLSHPQDLRSASRGQNSPGVRYGNIGFRVARTPGG